ncbi:MAG: cytochrome b/b6 domain-containing protein [Paucibacter sp.]|nr:cytochrome b/b6 domain-containing protein [Roseateles sp.]
MQSHTQKYDPLSQIFHWLSALAVLGAFVLGPGGFGRLMRQGVDPATRWDIVWHESLGVFVFAITLARLLWVALRPGRPDFELATWMRWLSRGVQLALWILMLCLPLTALLCLGGEGHPVTLLGPLRLDLSDSVGALAIAHALDWGDVHQFLGDLIMWLAGAHALAAILHGVVLKDGVLSAMLPGRLSR